MKAPFLAAALLATAGAAFAQAPVQQRPQAVVPPAQGFFRPAPDVSLTNPQPPASLAPGQQQLQVQGQQPVNPGAPREVALEQPGEGPFGVMRWAEEQMDRSTLENQRARQQFATTPPGVGAAFDGTTSERNR